MQMGVSECWVSIGRIQKFLESPELEINPEVPLICDDNPEAALQISNATCHWNGSGTKSSTATVSSNNSVSDNGSADDSEMDTTGLVVAVNDVNLDFDLSQLTCIIGEVGSGKSALIQMVRSSALNCNFIRHRCKQIDFQMFLLSETNSLQASFLFPKGLSNAKPAHHWHTHPKILGSWMVLLRKTFYLGDLTTKICTRESSSPAASQ